MRVNQRPNYLYFIIIAGLVILQTTFFRFINIKRINPDLVLVFLYFAAHFRGPLEGQLMGFLAGALEDILSLAPFGFNTLIRTVIGFIAGSTHGKIYFDPFLLPMITLLITTLVKQVLVTLLALIFIDQAGSLWGVGFWIELGLNLVLTPVIFNLFRVLGFFVETGRHII
jgi:rod shape-determining protein MreD